MAGKKTTTTTTTTRAQDGGDRLDDSEQQTPKYSPICTYCKHWLPGDGYHCAGAYPRGGATIPMPIWRGQNMHIGPYPNAQRPTDHGVHFEPHPGVKRTRSNAKLLDAYAAAHGGTKK